MIPKTQNAPAILAAIGIGMRTPHFGEIIATRPAIGWLEVHAENYLGGGPAPMRLDTMRQEYPLSLHGVGLSLGSAEGLVDEHLRRLRALIARTEPFLVSEHLSWSITGDAYLNDLLPLPYTEESLDIVVGNVAKAQAALGRRLLIENPANYLRYRYSTIPEPDFLGELVRRSGCGLLCDVNNIFVTCANLDLNAETYLEALPAAAVGEIHVAGHSRLTRGSQGLLIDDHGSPVAPPVWDLYRRALKRFGLVPSLVEWDNNLPPLSQLLDEAWKAERAALATVDFDVCAA
jgi:uncharacterized protein